MATIDHVVSRYHVHRWVRKKKNQRRKSWRVMSVTIAGQFKKLFACLVPEILSRSQGFSLSPRGKPKIIKPLPTAREALKKLNA